LSTSQFFALLEWVGNNVSFSMAGMCSGVKKSVAAWLEFVMVKKSVSA
jgi:hypothetical protein